MPLVFEWDQRKARANLRKHRVSFTEAISVFTDPLAQIFEDEGNSVAERREIIIDHSAQERLLVIAFAQRMEDLVRIISARRATRREQQDYEENVAN